MVYFFEIISCRSRAFLCMYFQTSLNTCQRFWTCILFLPLLLKVPCVYDGRSRQGHKHAYSFTPQKMKFCIKDCFIKCYQICRKSRIRAHLLKKSLMENVIYCTVFPLRVAFQAVFYYFTTKDLYKKKLFKSWKKICVLN